jgi:hypothetical protein
MFRRPSRHCFCSAAVSCWSVLEPAVAISELRAIGGFKLSAEFMIERVGRAASARLRPRHGAIPLLLQPLHPAIEIDLQRAPAPLSRFICAR